MAYIKAYSDENARHPDLFKAPATHAEVVWGIEHLCKHFGLPLLPIGFKGASGGTFYHRGLDAALRFRFQPQETGINWLLVCHEFSHYLTWAERRGKRADLQHNIDKAFDKAGNLRLSEAVREAARAQLKVLIEKRNELVSRRGHSADFARNVDKVCSYMRTTGPAQKALVSLPATAPEAGEQAAAKTTEKPWYHTRDIVKETYSSLPEYARCPKCERSRHKDEFGIRVTNRAVDGTPTRARRQSYCNPCRRNS